MTIDEFLNVELRVGKVLCAERMEGSDKLIRMDVDLGETNEDGLSKPRQILAGVGKVYTPENLTGRNIIVVANLDSRKMMGKESQGMLLAAHDDAGAAVLLNIEKNVPPGTRIG